jgi:hypothetical protein
MLSISINVDEAAMKNLGRSFRTGCKIEDHLQYYAARHLLLNNVEL